MEDSPKFTFKQRLKLALISGVGRLAIWLIGPTLRYDIYREPGAPKGSLTIPAVYAFWHRCVFPAVFRFRNFKIAVMTSRSFDGEYIARIIESFGFRAVRGSSSRGAVQALLGMHREIEQGRAVAFTIDGPRGPRYVAKPGPVLLARNTQAPLIPFHLQPARHWTLNSWDAFMIPKPFSRVVVLLGSVIPVPPEADNATHERLHAELQASLERVRDWCEAEAYGLPQPPDVAVERTEVAKPR